eukprot:32578-Rhodomonas_salina.2
MWNGGTGLVSCAVLTCGMGVQGVPEPDEAHRCAQKAGEEGGRDGGREERKEGGRGGREAQQEE